MDKIPNTDLYEILHIEKNATVNEIKMAYRRLARIYHPDINETEQGKQIFKDIRLAYEILSDSQKKKLYDLKNGFNQEKEEIEDTPPEPEVKSENTEERKNSNNKNLSKLLADILEGIFVYVKKVGGSKIKNFKGEDIYANVTISSKEALFGTNRIVNIMQNTLCPNCQGKKFINESLCPLCKGTGEISSHKRINVKIPANTKNGDKIKIEGYGNINDKNSKTDNLYLIVTIDEKSLFTVKENIVYMDLPITPYEAALGANIQIPTVYEDISIKIPPNTSSGQRFRLKGQGIFDKESGEYADMIVTVIIKLPQKLSQKEIELYEKLRENNTCDIRERLFNNE